MTTAEEIILTKAASTEEKVIGALLGGALGGGASYLATGKKTKHRGAKVGAAALLSALGGGYAGETVGDASRTKALLDLTQDHIGTSTDDATKRTIDMMLDTGAKHPFNPFLQAYVNKSVGKVDMLNAVAHEANDLAFNNAAEDNLGTAAKIAELLKLDKRYDSLEGLRDAIEGEGSEDKEAAVEMMHKYKDDANKYFRAHRPQ